jgi:hypothetical protein
VHGQAERVHVYCLSVVCLSAVAAAVVTSPRPACRAGGETGPRPRPRLRPRPTAPESGLGPRGRPWLPPPRPPQPRAASMRVRVKLLLRMSAAVRCPPAVTFPGGAFGPARGLVQATIPRGARFRGRPQQQRRTKKQTDRQRGENREAGECSDDDDGRGGWWWAPPVDADPPPPASPRSVLARSLSRSCSLTNVEKDHLDRRRDGVGHGSAGVCGGGGGWCGAVRWPETEKMRREVTWRERD